MSDAAAVRSCVDDQVKRDACVNDRMVGSVARSAIRVTRGTWYTVLSGPADRVQHEEQDRAAQRPRSTAASAAARRARR